MSEQAAWHVKRATLPVPVHTGRAVRARIWMAGPPLLLALLAALVATKLEQPLWRGQVEVAFQRSSLVGALTSSVTTHDPATYLQSQMALARSATVAERVVLASGIAGLTAKEFLHASAARAVPNSDVMELSTSNAHTRLALRLTNVYAFQFIRSKRELDLRTIREVQHELESMITRLRRRGDFSSPRYRALLQKRDELKQYGTLVSGQAVLQSPADEASSFRPHPLRNGLVGGLFGALVGIALVIGSYGRSRRNADRQRKPTD